MQVSGWYPCLPAHSSQSQYSQVLHYRVMLHLYNGFIFSSLSHIYPMCRYQSYQDTRNVVVLKGAAHSHQTTFWSTSQLIEKQILLI